MKPPCPRQAGTQIPNHAPNLSDWAAYLLAGWGHFGNSRTMIVIYWFAPRLGFDFRSSPVTIFGNNFKILFLTTFLNNYNIVYNVWKFKIIFYTLKYVLKINNIINF